VKSFINIFSGKAGRQRERERERRAQKILSGTEALDTKHNKNFASDEGKQQKNSGEEKDFWEDFSLFVLVLERQNRKGNTEEGDSRSRNG
jgi:hypothetical protein